MRMTTDERLTWCKQRMERICEEVQYHGGKEETKPKNSIKMPHKTSEKRQMISLFRGRMRLQY